MTAGAQTRTQGKLLDYKEFIEHQIALTRRRIKYTDLVTACLTLAAGLALVLLIEVVLDHAFGLPVFVRRMILMAGTVSAAAFILMRVVRPLAMSINAMYAAKTIEGADPDIKNSLINYLEIRRDPARVSKNVMAALESRAVADLTQIELDDVVDQRRAMQTAYALCGVIVAFCIYAAFTPKSILDSTKRAFLADVVRPTNTKLVNIKPGDDPELAEIVAGSHVQFSVDVQGVRPEKVKLHYSADGGKFYAVKEFDPGKNYYDPWAATLTNLQQSLDYFVTANDAESLHYELKVLPAPMIESVMIDYEFPRYTGVPPRTDIEGGNVEALEGTIVTVHARTNEPARAGSLNLTAGASAGMTVSEADPRELTGKFKVEKTGTYTINFRTTGGQLNPNPVVHDILALPDRPPAARFVKPERSGVKVPANVPVDLVMTGDDDHGVKDATLHVMLGQEALVTKNVLEGRPPRPAFEDAEILDLEQLKVPAGSTLTYWLAVRDNREPTSNRIETPRWTLEVGDPVAPQEKQEIEQRQAEERERREREAREAQQNQPPPPSDPTQEQDPARQAEQPLEQPDQAPQGESRPDGGTPRDERPAPDRGENPPDRQPGDADEDPNAQPGENPGGEPGRNPDPADAEKLRRAKEFLQKKGLLDKDPGRPQDQPANPGAPGGDQSRQGDEQPGERPRMQQPDAAPAPSPPSPSPPPTPTTAPAKSTPASAPRIQTSPASRSPVSPAIRSRAIPAIRSRASPGIRSRAARGSEVGPAWRPEVRPARGPEVGAARRSEVGPARGSEVRPARRSEVGSARRSEVGPARGPEVRAARRSEVRPAWRSEVGSARRSEVGPSRRSEVGPARRPEVRPAWRPEVRAARGSEVRAARGSEVGPAWRPEVRAARGSEVGPAWRPEVRAARGPEVGPARGSEVRPARRSEVGSARRSEVGPARGPEVRAARRSEVRPARRSEVGSARRSEVRPAWRPEVRPAR
ncbi:hypothetical protein [Planctomyces sp. SH-PL62]|uniref:hypothetical protein n=1 Tax=Planctomyces sp. SH-PL62 TaxID=1636152 RepID=UPI00078D773F|nr:hypothetical protein [Planctomyces sp. SH-PL62]AMV37622.1 hypothetical protein VT85_09305 [Planctomyces sp. SH-PL62]